MSLITFVLLTAQASTSNLYAVEIESESRVEVEDRTVSCSDPPKRGPRSAQPCDVHQWEAYIIDAYPRKALMDEVEGAIRIYGMVDEKGRFANCAAHSLSKPFALVRLACGKIGDHGRFLPALDQEGKARAAPVSLILTYVLPEWPNQAGLIREAQPIKQAEWVKRISANLPTINIERPKEITVDLRFMVGKRGRVDRCEAVKVDGHQVFGRAACLGMYRYARYEPALDKNGMPAHSVLTTTIVYRWE